MATARKTTQGQKAEDYPKLGDAEAVQETAPEPAPAPAQEQAAKSADPVFNPKQQFSMVWHNGLKAYLQNGVIFDRGSKLPVGKA